MFHDFVILLFKYFIVDTIKALVFDVDGTLYRPISELSAVLHNYWVKRIADQKHISVEQGEPVYEELRSRYKSATMALSKIGVGKPFEIAKQSENYLSKYIRAYLKPDRKLTTLVKKLQDRYRLYTLRNGTRTGTRFILKQLGFVNKRPAHVRGFGPFDDILPTTELGVTKPDASVFRNVLKTLSCKPNEIVIVGDRSEVDLEPAHKLGMKTVLVSWGKQELFGIQGVDAVIETIYDTEELTRYEGRE